MKREIQRVYDENHQVYGVRKVWRQLLREGIRVARCTVARLMAVMGLAGVLRGKKVRTTVSRKAVAAGDRVNRQFVAERPDQLWVADFTYVSTWQGVVYVAFIIDVFAGYIVGWRVSSSMETTFVLDALEQALWARRPSGTVHHSDKGSQYVSLAYTQRLKEAGLLASTGSTGTVARLMAVMGLAGVLRGKKVRTTVSRKTVATGDRVNRQFVAERPDQLWVADFTYVSTWRGFVYVAFIIDVFAGYIVGWRVSSSMETTFVLDALEQALWARRPSGTVHHSDKGSQYVSLAYTQRLKEAGLLASTGSTGDSYDNAMAESINGLYKAEVIHRKSWKNRAEVELATLTWVDWYNNRRLLERLGHTPPAEAEKAYYASIGNDDLAA
ncbi:IS3 family transposase [Escherichia coli]|nr:IS3 family transposase [Escherichia coli]